MQERTSDGMWEQPGTNKSPMDASRRMSAGYKNNHNYNNPQWAPFRWVFNDD
jgi:hypothetical protein